MALEIRKHANDDPTVAAFIGEHETYLFQKPLWSQVLESLGYATAYYCLEDDGRIVLAQPVVDMQVGFFRILYCGVPYGGAVGEESHVASFLEQLPAVARREGYHRIRLSRSFYDPPFSPPGYKVQEHVQQVLHFSGRSIEQVWDDFKSRVRRDVRLAERRGVTIETASDPAARQALFAMYAKTMDRNTAFVLWLPEMLEQLWTRIVEPGWGEMLIARHESEPLAGLVALYSGRRCFYFIGASSGAKRNLCPNDAVIWEAICRASARGCDDFDFMMSSHDDQLLIDFKAKWGAARYPFLFYERDLRPLYCAAWDLSFRLAKTRLGYWAARLIKRR